MALCRRAVRIWLSRFQAIAAGSEGLAAAPHAVSAAEASWGAEVGRGQQQARHCSSACSSSATPTFAMSGVTSSAATRDYSSKARQPNMASAGGLATHSPASVAASLVSSLDSLPRERLLAIMAMECSQLVAGINRCRPSEVAAFCTAAMTLDFYTQCLVDAVVKYLPGKVAELSGDELAGPMWVLSKKATISSRLSADLGNAVLKRLEDVPLADVGSLLLSVACLCPQSPSILSSLACTALDRSQGCTAADMVALVDAFGSPSVRRSLFDDKVFQRLADSILDRIQEFSQPQLRTVLCVFREVCADVPALQATLGSVEAVLVPLTMDPLAGCSQRESGLSLACLRCKNPHKNVLHALHQKSGSKHAACHSSEQPLPQPS